MSAALAAGHPTSSRLPELLALPVIDGVGVGVPVADGVSLTEDVREAVRVRLSVPEMVAVREVEDVSDGPLLLTALPPLSRREW